MLLSQAFATWRGSGADSAATLLRDAIFCVCVGSGSFVTIGRRTAQFCLIS